MIEQTKLVYLATLEAQLDKIERDPRANGDSIVTFFEREIASLNTVALELNKGTQWRLGDVLIYESCAIRLAAIILEMSARMRQTYIDNGGDA